MTSQPLPITIRSVNPDDLDAYRTLRLDALRLHPEAFGADYEVQAAFSREDWLERMGDGSFVADQNGALVGMAGVHLNNAPKAKHAGMVWGVFVHPDARGAQLGDKLIRACIDWAKKKNLYILKLSVTTTNVSAIRCYTRCGFTVYGVDPALLYYDGKYYDGLLMSRCL